MGTQCRHEGSPWVPGRGGPDEALGSVGTFYVLLVDSLYYSYIHRNKSVARGGGREIQEGGDTCTPMANSC